MDLWISKTLEFMVRKKVQKICRLPFMSVFRFIAFYILDLSVVGSYLYCILWWSSRLSPCPPSLKVNDKIDQIHRDMRRFQPFETTSIWIKTAFAILQTPLWLSTTMQSNPFWCCILIRFLRFLKKKSKLV